MDKAKQHWKILQGLGSDLANRVQEFMVIGGKGEGVIVATDDGLTFWFGEMKFAFGESKTTNKPTLLNVPDLVEMAHGDNHILLLTRRGEIYSMGQNDRGELGLGVPDRKTHFTPQLISSPHKFISVRCGWWHSLALTEDGKVCAWGWNECCQLGVFNFTLFLPFPRQIPELDTHRVVAVECGGGHSLALTDQGEVYAWGWNGYGQSCENGPPLWHIPTRISTPSPVQSMAAGVSHTMLLAKTGEVFDCGYNGWGQRSFLTTHRIPYLSKVEGLPTISQIASHNATSLKIAISSDQRCFVWGKLNDEKSEEKVISMDKPWKLPSVYSTVESPFSFYSPHRNTPHSVSVIPPSRLSARMSRMFDNPATSDVQFVVEQRTIHAHRNILCNFSDYFVRMFSERLMAPVDREDPIVRVTISDHSYQAFYAFLRFLYTDSLEVYPDLLPKLFELAIQYLVPDLQQLCLLRMRETLIPATCCLYYPLTHRHSLLPELATFQQELVQFASTRMSEVVDSAAYQSMESDLCKNLTNAVQNFLASTSNVNSNSI